MLSANSAPHPDDHAKRYACAAMIRISRPVTRLHRLALCAGLLTGLWTSACVAGTDSQPTWAVGIGVEHMPSWAGAATSRYQPIPYVDIEIPNHLSLSTQDGLQVDLIGGPDLHGGIYGDYQWGRESDDLGVLRHRIKPLSPRLTLGGYLEWQPSRQIDIGSDLSHDIKNKVAPINPLSNPNPPPSNRSTGPRTDRRALPPTARANNFTAI